MREKILEALGTFNVKVDEYWTDDGLPLIEAVAHLAGLPDVTRGMITSAAPGFSRSNPSLMVGTIEAEVPPPPPPETPDQPQAEPSAESEPVVTPATETSSEVTEGDMTATDQETDIPEDTDVNSDIEGEGDDPLTEAEEEDALAALEEGERITEREKQALREKYTAQMSELSERIGEKVQQKNKLTSEMNDLIVQQRRLDDLLKELTDVNKNVTAVQNYHASQKALLEARGKVIKERMANGPQGKPLPLTAPIDQSMRRRNQRGTKRPQTLLRRS